MMKVPGLSNIPVLGSLFRSRQENKAKTELIVMVTPELASPLATADAAAAGPPMPRLFLTPEPAATAAPARPRQAK
jgi:Flp pilus assembly secretin CpaC